MTKRKEWANYGNVWDPERAKLAEKYYKHRLELNAKWARTDKGRRAQSKYAAKRRKLLKLYNVNKLTDVSKRDFARERQYLNDPTHDVHYSNARTVGATSANAKSVRKWGNGW